MLGRKNMVGINPLEWMGHVLENLHDNTTPEQIKMMLPFYYKESRG